MPVGNPFQLAFELARASFDSVRFGLSQEPSHSPRAIVMKCK